MKISIIIATYNASKTLNTCLNSIVPQLTNDTELILVDGNSDDNTNDIIDSYGNKVAVHISERDNGIYDAWNKGIKLSKGEWIMFMGADDILLPNALNIYMNTIKSTENINDYDYICAHNEYVDQEGRLLKILGKEPIWSEVKYKMTMAHVASLHNRKNLFDAIGIYNIEYKICADYELLMRKKDGLHSLFINARIARMKVGGMSFSIKAIKETYKIRKLYSSLPFCMNELYFIRDVFAFYFFIFRKRICGKKI